MLTEIHIRDFATIEQLDLPFQTGGSMITGETGAGKSIFIEAIELALGARGSQNMIRPGKGRADISLYFNIDNLPKAAEWLNQHDFSQDSSECMIRRAIASDGRSRCYINGYPATQQLTRELGEHLFHLHGQYEQQVLLKSENQRELLDRYAGHQGLLDKIKTIVDEYHAIEKEIHSVRELTAKRNERCEYLRFQLDELEQLKLTEGEWEKLEAEHHKLTHSEELLRNLQTATARLDEDEYSILANLNDIRKSLDKVKNIEPKITEWLNIIDSSHIQLSELKDELSEYLNSADLDPERLQFIEQRVSQIYDTARKHKIQPQELIQLQNELQKEWDAIENSDQHLADLTKKQKHIADCYAKLAEKLTVSRKTIAAKLEKTITKTIRGLSLPHANFQIAFEKSEQPISIHGQEKITFKITTNPDHALQPIAKVISGGELSRLSLAVHLALADQISTPTLIFDEVDTGIGGATAEKVGKLLRKLGETYQLFCVTHHPQVAACGQFHLLVEKNVVDNCTFTSLRFLNSKERQAELARMLGGEKITDTTLAHAEEMLAVLNPG